MIKINPNKIEAAEIKKAIQKNEGYCPCKIFKTQDTKCICKDFRTQKSGYCECGLYYKE